MQRNNNHHNSYQRVIVACLIMFSAVLSTSLSSSLTANFKQVAFKPANFVPFPEYNQRLASTPVSLLFRGVKLHQGSSALFRKFSQHLVGEKSQPLTSSTSKARIKPEDTQNHQSHLRLTADSIYIAAP